MFGPMELIIIAAIGFGCLAVLIGVIALVYFLNRRREP